MSSSSVLLPALLACFLLDCVDSHRSREQGLKAPYLLEGTPTPPPQWVDQKLDHMSSSSGDKTWKQQYFVNSSWWDKDKGPVFLLLGGEGPANPAWLVADTNIMRNAQKYRALVFTVEHRYVR